MSRSDFRGSIRPLDLLYVGTLPPHPGGSAISCAQLLTAISRRGHGIRAISPVTELARQDAERFAQTSPGLEIQRFPMPYFETGPDEPASPEYRELEWQGVRSAVDQQVGTARPDLLIAGRESFALHVGPLARMHRIPYCVWIRGGSTMGALCGSLPEDEVRRLFSEIAGADLVVVPARHLVDALLQFSVPGARVILNAIDLERFTPQAPDRALQKALGLDEADIVVAHVSNLKIIKRPLDFVAAAAAAWKRESRLRFLIVGDGSLRQAFESAVAEACMLDQFVFTGWVDYDRMPHYLSLADAVVMPSGGEGLARVYLETMASERVLIASNIAAAAEIITHGENGLLFPVGDVDALSEQMIRVARDPSMRRRIGRRARESVLAHHIDTAADAYIDAFVAQLGWRA
jgi:glycosyltransferase involved in cell wall biosynthesis